MTTAAAVALPIFSPNLKADDFSELINLDWSTLDSAVAGKSAPTVWVESATLEYSREALMAKLQLWIAGLP